MTKIVTRPELPEFEVTIAEAVGVHDDEVCAVESSTGEGINDEDGEGDGEGGGEGEGEGGGGGGCGG